MNIALVRNLVWGGIGVVAGTGLGYLIGSKVTAKKWQAFADEQVAQVKEHYKILRKEGEYGDPETVPTRYEESRQGRGVDFDHDYAVLGESLNAVADLILEQGYDAARQIVGYVEDDVRVDADGNLEATLHITRDAADESIFDKVVTEGPDGRPRDRKRPYVITFDEWNATQDSEFHLHDTPTMRYYIRDDTAIDSAEGIMLNVDEVIGETNLNWFVEEEFDPSKEDNSFYVRNEKLDLSLEIIVFQTGYVDSLQLDHIEDEEDKPRRKPKLED